jgi:hypothetical protein
LESGFQNNDRGARRYPDEDPEEPQTLYEKKGERFVPYDPGRMRTRTALMVAAASGALIAVGVSLLGRKHAA